MTAETVRPGKIARLEFPAAAVVGEPVEIQAYAQTGGCVFLDAARLSVDEARQHLEVRATFREIHYLDRWNCGGHVETTSKVLVFTPTRTGIYVVESEDHALTGTIEVKDASPLASPSP